MNTLEKMVIGFSGILLLAVSINYVVAGDQEKNEIRAKQSRMKEISAAVGDIRNKFTAKSEQLKQQKEQLKQEIKKNRDELKASLQLAQEQSKAAKEEFKMAVKKAKETAKTDVEKKDIDTIEKEASKDIETVSRSVESLGQIELPSDRD